MVLACPLTPRTTGLIGPAELAQMRPGAVLVNVSRGLVVQEAALFAALRERRIAGAVLDVWYRYPDLARGARTCRPSSPACPFHTLPNVVMTPHMSGWSDGRTDRSLDQVLDNLSRLAQGRPLLNVVDPSHVSVAES